MRNEDIICCGTCREEYEPLGEVHELNGQPICIDCVEMCDGYCGELLLDSTIKTFGPVVTFRDWLSNGKLLTAHAECAAEYIVALIASPNYYDGDATREEIADIIHAYQLEVAA